jgi:hypothetical protein
MLHWAYKIPAKFVWIEGVSFAGWGCSESSWLFNSSGPPIGKSLDGMKQHFQMQLSEEFAAQACAKCNRV